MWQVRLDAFGGPDELHLVEVPDPVPGPGQVLVRTAAAGITFVETQVRAGRPPWPGPGPALRSCSATASRATSSVSGRGLRLVARRRVVTATGGFARLCGPGGRRRLGPHRGPRQPRARGGGGAPGGRSYRARAGAGGLARPGDRVLVTAAAGGVGSLLVQLARAAGVKRVVAAAGGERKLAVAAGLGADLTVDYARRAGRIHWKGSTSASTGSAVPSAPTCWRRWPPAGGSSSTGARAAP